MEAGNTFKFGRTAHLWVVISDPSIDPKQVVIINMTTDRGIDNSCILKCGDHDLIRHDTCMRYDRSRIETNNHLEQLITMGSITLYKPVKAEILERIRYGAGVSNYIPLECRQILITQGLIEP
jgi:hypothetical protein